MYIDVKIVELPLLHHPAYSLVTTHCGSHNGTANGPHGWSRPPANNHAVYSMQSGWRGKYSFGNTYDLDFVFDISVLCGMYAGVWSHIALQPSSIFILVLLIRGRLQNVVSSSKAVCKLKNVSHQQLFILTFKTARTGLARSWFIHFLSRSFVYSYLDSP